MKKLLLVLVEVLESRAQYTERHNILESSHSACPFDRFTFRSTNAKTRTYKFKASLSGSPESAVRSVSFCSGFMPLIVFCISYPVSVSLVSAADSNLCLALPSAIADCTNKIPGCAHCPVRRPGPVVEQYLESRGSRWKAFGYICVCID